MQETRFIRVLPQWCALLHLTQQTATGTRTCTSCTEPDDTHVQQKIC